MLAVRVNHFDILCFVYLYGERRDRNVRRNSIPTRRSSDLIRRYEISLDIGPTRHGITRGQTIYFFDPSGNRNETFSGGYSYYPDNPRRTWQAENAGKAIFYYEKVLTDRFMTVNT